MTPTVGDVAALAVVDPQIPSGLIPITLRSENGTASAVLGASTNHTYLSTGFGEARSISRVNELRQNPIRPRAREHGIMTTELAREFGLLQATCLPALTEITESGGNLISDLERSQIEDAIRMFKDGYLARQSILFFTESSEPLKDETR